MNDIIPPCRVCPPLISPPPPPSLDRAWDRESDRISGGRPKNRLSINLAVHPPPPPHSIRPPWSIGPLDQWRTCGWRPLLFGPHASACRHSRLLCNLSFTTLYLWLKLSPSLAVNLEKWGVKKHLFKVLLNPEGFGLRIVTPSSPTEVIVCTKSQHLMRQTGVPALPHSSSAWPFPLKAGANVRWITLTLLLCVSRKEPVLIKIAYCIEKCGGLSGLFP